MWVRLFRGRLPRLFTNSFNSRTRVGATSHHRPAGLPHEVSIHAPVWVRQEGLSSMSSYEGFQFTHPCGCDLMSGLSLTTENCFNSRTRVGATPHPQDGAVVHRVSIHAPVWVRRSCETSLKRMRSFNSRTRVGATALYLLNGVLPPVSIHAPVWVRRLLFMAEK